MGRTPNIVPVTTQDYRRLAEQRLPRFLFDYIAGGANDELTLEANVRDFQRHCIRQRVLRDVSHVDTTTTMAGMATSMPLALAPVGMIGLFAKRGEVQGVRAADRAGVPFTLSTVGVCSIEEVGAAASKPFWFQLYMIRDRKEVQSLLERAMAAGCTTLVFTVDLAVAGMRHRDVRNGMLARGVKGVWAKASQTLTKPGWVCDVAWGGRPLSFGSMAHVIPHPTDLNAFRSWLDAQFDPTVTWHDIAWLRGIWKGQLILKGIQEPDDARGAVEVGADGVVVSNHGGRQLDSTASSISKLPAVVEAVGAHIEVWVDGGARSGLDVFKAVALGARGVLIGRPWAFAVAGAGQAGVVDLLATFQREFAVAMALSGVTRVEHIKRDHLDPG